MRTWSPRGETPVLQYNFNWDTLSAAAGITFYNFYFRLYQGTVKSAEVVDFLGALLRHVSDAPGTTVPRASFTTALTLRVSPAATNGSVDAGTSVMVAGAPPG